ncbi:MAG TPA: tetratricopeptide repeat protein [Candidatus Binatia bacterium]|nr:tetratricopeptide repeat protein [Candidatus Binatia bacterium]
MTTVQILAIGAIALPALAVVLWPLLAGSRRAVAVAMDVAAHRRLELSEEKAALYRALRELAFDREAGNLSAADYQALRDGYETRAAEVLGALDELGPAPEPVALVASAAQPRGEERPEAARGWTRHPVALAGGAAALLAFGVVVGLGASRFTAPDLTVLPPGSRIPVTIAPEAAAPPPGDGSASAASGRAIPPEMLAGMLGAARQSLTEGRYQEAIAAYQAVLKRDATNVDAMTHLGLIVAIGGHADTALEAFERALAIDPAYPPAHLYRGQILYEVKRDYPGAVAAWQQFLTLVPRGEEHDRVRALVQQAQEKQRGG